jgi:hypothetical protein
LVWIPVYASKVWDNIVRCLLKVKEEGDYV